MTVYFKKNVSEKKVMFFFLIRVTMVCLSSSHLNAQCRFEIEITTLSQLIASLYQVRRGQLVKLHRLCRDGWL